MKQEKKRILLNCLVGILFLLYPMRHVWQGIDLQDTGYNYANFLYMGLDHMDPMWLYSTYLATALGHFFTLLPMGKTVIGLNIYTGLLVSGLAGMSYWFCTSKLKMPSGLVVLGEFLAMNLCWCPTAVLYNYLTYVLFLCAAMLVYLGLTKENKYALVVAGICLGSNILVRFSNLPEAGLILAVWAYSFWKKDIKTPFRNAVQNTGFCLAGYLGGLAFWGVYIQLRYGLGNYVAGIRRLFAMTETATDYKSSSMLLGLVLPFKGMIYYVIRMLFFVVLALVCVAVCELVKKCIGERFSRVISVIEGIGAALACIVMCLWLYKREYVSFAYYSYDSMYRPAIFLLLLAMVIAVVVILLPRFAKEEKLLSAIVVLVLLLSSLGSNNNVYPSINNMFLTAPYTLFFLWKFTRWGEKVKTRFDFLKIWPISGAGWSMVTLLLIHAVVFGAGFVFAESTGVQEFGGRVNTDGALQGIHMQTDRAAYLAETEEFIKNQGLEGQELISYGKIPAVSFFFRMPAAFNPWCDLDSYNYTQMEKDLRETEEKLLQEAGTKPVIMLEHIYEMLYTDNRAILEEEGMNPEWLDFLEAAPKWNLLQEYMDRYDYKMEYDNEKLSIWR